MSGRTWNLAPTRGDYALPGNVTPRQLAGRTRKRIAALRESVEQLSAPWIDVYNPVDDALRGLLDAFAEFERTVDDAIAYLDEAAP